MRKGFFGSNPVRPGGPGFLGRSWRDGEIGRGTSSLRQTRPAQIPLVESITLLGGFETRVEVLGLIPRNRSFGVGTEIDKPLSIQTVKDVCVESGFPPIFVNFDISQYPFRDLIFSLVGVTRDRPT